MDINKQPGINIKNISLEDLVLKKRFKASDAQSNIQLSVNINLSRTVIINQEKTNGTVELKATISELETRFIVELVYVLAAEVIPGQENMTIDEFLHNNAPSILYQFIRETTTTIFQKAGLIGIVLPPLNLIAFFKDAET